MIDWVLNTPLINILHLFYSIRQQPTYYLSVFDHFMGLALKVNLIDRCLKVAIVQRCQLM